MVPCVEVHHHVHQPRTQIDQRSVLADPACTAHLDVVDGATAPELVTASGRYYDREREATPTAAAEDDALAARLWTESERMTGLA